MYWPAQLGEIRYRQGRLAEMADALRSLAELRPNIAFRVGLVLLYCESDLLDKAKEQFERFAAHGFDLPLDPNWVASMFVLAEVCGALHDGRAAELLYAKLQPLAQQIGLPVTLSAATARWGTQPASLQRACTAGRTPSGISNMRWR